MVIPSHIFKQIVLMNIFLHKTVAVTTVLNVSFIRFHIIHKLIDEWHPNVNITGPNFAGLEHKYPGDPCWEYCILMQGEFAEFAIRESLVPRIKSKFSSLYHCSVNATDEVSAENEDSFPCVVDETACQDNPAIMKKTRRQKYYGHILLT